MLRSVVQVVDCLERLRVVQFMVHLRISCTFTCNFRCQLVFQIWTLGPPTILTPDYFHFIFTSLSLFYERANPYRFAKWWLMQRQTLCCIIRGPHSSWRHASRDRSYDHLCLIQRCHCSHAGYHPSPYSLHLHNGDTFRFFVSFFPFPLDVRVLRNLSVTTSPLTTTSSPDQLTM